MGCISYKALGSSGFQCYFSLLTHSFSWFVFCIINLTSGVPGRDLYKGKSKTDSAGILICFSACVLQKPFRRELGPEMGGVTQEINDL